MAPDSPRPASQPLRGPDAKDFRLPLDCHHHRASYYAAPHQEIGFTEIRMAVRGAGEMLIGTRVLPLERGDVVVIPPNVTHGYTCRSLEFYDIVMHESFLGRHAAALGTLPGFAMWFHVEPYYRTQTGRQYGLRLEPAERRRMVGLFRLLEEELNLGDEVCPAGAEALALFIVARLCRLYARQFQDVSALPLVHRPTLAFQQVFELVAERYAEKLSLGDLAAAAHMERSYFGRVFRQIMGLTPMQYLNRHRVHVASRLLQETTEAISTIAQAVGLHDGSHFCHVFSRVTGISPRAFRHSLQVLDERDVVWDLRCPADREGGIDAQAPVKSFSHKKERL